jgi:hypothetical protein
MTAETSVDQLPPALGDPPSAHASPDGRLRPFAGPPPLLYLLLRDARVHSAIEAGPIGQDP